MISVFKRSTGTDMPNNTVLSVFNLRPRRIGGIETFARELSRQLGEVGWTSALCFTEEPTAEVRDFFDLPNVCVEVITGLSKWSLKSSIELARLLAHYRPSILHLTFTSLLGPYVWLGQLYGIQQVFFTDQISRPENYKPAPTSLWKKSIYRTAVPVTRVFCVSDFVRLCRVDAEQYPSSRITTIYNGVDIDRCQEAKGNGPQFRAKYALSPDSVVVAQIASMTPGKGYACLLQAARLVIDVAPQVRFVMAGDGNSLAKYVALARELGINDQVVFTGLVNDPIGEGLFAAADIVCQVSQWNEAFGFSIAEAMASGKPIIATRVGGIPELVQDRRTGFLVERGQPEELASKILELVSKSKLRESLGREGASLCKQRFDHRVNVRRLIKYYGL